MSVLHMFSCLLSGKNTETCIWIGIAQWNQKLENCLNINSFTDNVLELWPQELGSQHTSVLHFIVSKKLVVEWKKKHISTKKA